jgi:hypothetical protein
MVNACCHDVAVAGTGEIAVASAFGVFIYRLKNISKAQQQNQRHGSSSFPVLLSTPLLASSSSTVSRALTGSGTAATGSGGEDVITVTNCLRLLQSTLHVGTKGGLKASSSNSGSLSDLIAALIVALCLGEQRLIVMSIIAVSTYTGADEGDDDIEDGENLGKKDSKAGETSPMMMLQTKLIAYALRVLDAPLLVRVVASISAALANCCSRGRKRPFGVNGGEDAGAAAADSDNGDGVLFGVLMRWLVLVFKNHYQELEAVLQPQQQQKQKSADADRSAGTSYDHRGLLKSSLSNLFLQLHSLRKRILAPMQESMATMMLIDEVISMMSHTSQANAAAVAVAE